MFADESPANTCIIGGANGAPLGIPVTDIAAPALSELTARTQSVKGTPFCKPPCQK